MQGIGSFFNKFHQMLASTLEVEKAITEIIFEEAKVTLDRKEISVKENIAYIKVSPIKRNEIILRKEKILQRINEQLEEKNKIREIK